MSQQQHPLPAGTLLASPRLFSLSLTPSLSLSLRRQCRDGARDELDMRSCIPNSMATGNNSNLAAGDYNDPLTFSSCPHVNQGCSSVQSGCGMGGQEAAADRGGGCGSAVGHVGVSQDTAQRPMPHWHLFIGGQEECLAVGKGMIKGTRAG